MKWSDIDFDNDTMSIRGSFSGNVYRSTTKTGREVIKPLSEIVRDMLLPRKGLPNAFVFTHTRKGRPLGEAILRKHFNQARDKLGFPKSLVLYGATRHSMATEGYNSTGDIIAVKEALGHRELTTTMKYTHVDISASSKIIKPKGKLLQTDISKSLPNKK